MFLHTRKYPTHAVVILEMRSWDCQQAYWAYCKMPLERDLRECTHIWELLGTWKMARRTDTENVKELLRLLSVRRTASNNFAFVYIIRLCVYH